jgi:hypothetical protein
MIKPAITKCWTFLSSRGDRRYQTLLYQDGTASCDCPGWCRRVAGDGSRSCRHTRLVMLGTADRECDSAHDYATGSSSRPPAAISSTKVITDFGRMGRRKIHA